MRFPIASLVLVVVAFILLAVYAVMSFILGEFALALTPMANQSMGSYGLSMFNYEVGVLQLGFAFAGLFLFVIAVVIYIVDALRRERESDYY